jgi:acyl carrier protein
MGKMVTHAITVKGIVYGTMHVTCSEDEHRPEKLGDEVNWDWDSVEMVEVVDSEIIDGWEEAAE